MRPRREERKRHEEAMAKAGAEAEERVRGAQEEARKEREAARRAHDKQVGLCCWDGGVGEG
jgi:5-azacytidine-induced protein 1